MKKLLHKIGIHDWSKYSSFIIYGLDERGNNSMSKIAETKDCDKYSIRLCWICKKEMPHSRHFFNIGIKEKNAK